MGQLGRDHRTVTMINKELVKKRFKKSLTTYNAHAAVQKSMADKLVNILIELKGNNFGNILEIGCGTGLLTSNICNKMEFKKLYVNDIVGESANYINKISSGIDFIEGDAENAEFPQNLDLIISNAAFQWIDDFSAFLKKLKFCLNDNGVLAFTSFTTNHFNEISKITNSQLKYYENSEIIKTAEEFFITDYSWSEELKLEFSSAKEVLFHMKALGTNGIEKKYWTKKDIQEFESAYKDICSDGIELTYNPAYFILTKNLINS